MRSNFNSRTSCEVRRFPGLIMPSWPKFQLTHLLRGATPFSRHCSSIRSISTHAPLARCDLGVTIPIENVRKDFNSRTSCEVRPGADLRRQGRPISTHAPLARCDATRRSTGRMYFISTHAPLARCDPAGQDAGKSGVHISTHAPLARCDWPLNG